MSQLCYKHILTVTGLQHVYEVEVRVPRIADESRHQSYGLFGAKLRHIRNERTLERRDANAGNLAMGIDIRLALTLFRRLMSPLSRFPRVQPARNQ